MNQKRILKPLEVRNKKQELHNFVLNDIQEKGPILKAGFSQEDGTKVLQNLTDALWYLDGRQHIVKNAVKTKGTIKVTPLPTR